MIRQYWTRRAVGALVVGVASCGFGSSAYAASEGSSASAAAELEEVVVTAERVASTAQRTAISMEVMNSDDIKSAGLANISQLATISPSVNVTGFGGGTVITVRGISSRDTTEIGDPAVVVSYDGFYQDRSYALGLAQYDMERIEILRGPQGTLYGRNATGGAINIYTTRPGKEKGGYVQLEAGDYDALNGEGAFNIPLSDRTQLRASFGLQHHGPYRTDGGVYDGVDDANSRSLRLQLAFQPSDKLSARFTAQHTVQTALGSQAQNLAYRVTNANGWVDHSAIPPLGDQKTYAKYWFSRLNLNDSMFRYDIAYKASWATITYLGGYDRLVWNSIVPGANAITGPASNALPVPVMRVQAFNQQERPTTINQELRFQSANPDSRLQWQAGVYYFKNQNDLDSYNFAPNGTPGGSQTELPLAHFVYDVSIKSLAEMAHVSFQATDRLKLSAGVRHNNDKKTRTGYPGVGPAVFGRVPPPASVFRVSPTSDVNKNTYSLGIDFQVTPDSLLYAKYGTGYKAGGFTDVAEYGPESIKTAEIGSKNRFLDNRLELNFAAYKSDYTNQQVQQIVPSGGGLRIVNAGATSYKGAEGDLAWVVGDSRVEFNLAWLDAKFTDFALDNSQQRWNGTAWASTRVTSANIGTLGAPDYGPHAVLDLANGNVQLAGNSPQQAPTWTFGAALEHTWRGANGAFTARISAKSQSEQFYTFFNRPDDRQKPYTLANLLLTYQPTDSDYRYQAYVNNLSDETVFSNAGPNDRSNVYVYSYLPPRTMGLRVYYKW